MDKRKEKFTWMEQKEVLTYKAKWSKDTPSAASALISVFLARVLSETFYIKIVNTKRVPSFLNKSRIEHAFSWHTFTWAKKSSCEDKVFYVFNNTWRFEDTAAVTRKKCTFPPTTSMCSETLFKKLAVLRILNKGDAISAYYLLYHCRAQTQSLYGASLEVY